MENFKNFVENCDINLISSNGCEILSLESFYSLLDLYLKNPLDPLVVADEAFLTAISSMENFYYNGKKGCRYVYDYEKIDYDNFLERELEWASKGKLVRLLSSIPEGLLLRKLPTNIKNILYLNMHNKRLMLAAEIDEELETCLFELFNKLNFNFIKCNNNLAKNVYITTDPISEDEEYELKKYNDNCPLSLFERIILLQTYIEEYFLS